MPRLRFHKVVRGVVEEVLVNRAAVPESWGAIPDLEGLPDERVTPEAANVLADVRFTPDALAVLQEAAEAFLTGLFEDAMLAASHAGRVTVGPEDLKVVLQIRHI
jgi:histone H3/H4